MGLGVDGFGWRDVVDVRSDMERVEHLALGHQGRRLELSERTTRGDRHRQASRRRVVRRLDEREAVRLAEGIPEPAELAARLLKDLADRLLPILGALHESRPDLGLVAKGGHVKRHDTLLPEPTYMALQPYSLRSATVGLPSPWDAAFPLLAGTCSPTRHQKPRI